MCVIVYKPKDHNLPSQEILEKCFKRNPHGAGIMVARENKVIIKKGMMTFEDFQTVLTEMDIKKEEAAVLHFRIASVGKVQPSHCHPFPLSSDTKDLFATDLVAGVGVAHNGTITMEARDELSDTMTFIRDIFSKAAVFNNRLKYSVRTLVNTFLGGSKMIALFPEGKVEFYGESRHEWKKIDGCLYSNTKFLHEPKKKKEEAITAIKDLNMSTMREYISDMRDFFVGTKSRYYDGFVNSDSICPECSRSTFHKNDDGSKECSWCSYKS